MNTNHIRDLTVRLTKALDSNYDVVDMDAVMSVISSLEGTTITKEQLETTRLAKYINQLRRRTKCKQLAHRSKSLLKKWRKMVGMPQQQQLLQIPATALMTATTSIAASQIHHTATATTTTTTISANSNVNSLNNTNSNKGHELTNAATTTTTIIGDCFGTSHHPPTSFANILSDYCGGGGSSSRLSKQSLKSPHVVKQQQQEQDVETFILEQSSNSGSVLFTNTNSKPHFGYFERKLDQSRNDNKSYPLLRLQHQQQQMLQHQQDIIIDIQDSNSDHNDDCSTPATQKVSRATPPLINSKSSCNREQLYSGDVSFMGTFNKTDSKAATKSSSSNSAFRKEKKKEKRRAKEQQQQQQQPQQPQLELALNQQESFNQQNRQEDFNSVVMIDEISSQSMSQQQQQQYNQNHHTQKSQHSSKHLTHHKRFNLDKPRDIFSVANELKPQMMNSNVSEVLSLSNSSMCSIFPNVLLGLTPKGGMPITAATNVPAANDAFNEDSFLTFAGKFQQHNSVHRHSNNGSHNNNNNNNNNSNNYYSSCSSSNEPFQFVDSTADNDFQSLNQRHLQSTKATQNLQQEQQQHHDMPVVVLQQQQQQQLLLSPSSTQTTTFLPFRGNLPDNAVDRRYDVAATLLPQSDGIIGHAGGGRNSNDSSTNHSVTSSQLDIIDVTSQESIKLCADVTPKSSPPRNIGSGGGGEQQQHEPNFIASHARECQETTTERLCGILTGAASSSVSATAGSGMETNSDLKQPKKRGRKKGSKGVDGLIAKETSLSSQMFIYAQGNYKVKTTKELYAEMQNRKMGSSHTTPALSTATNTSSSAVTSSGQLTKISVNSHNNTSSGQHLPSRPASSCSETSINSPHTLDACSTNATISTMATRSTPDNFLFNLHPDESCSDSQSSGDNSQDSHTALQRNSLLRHGGGDEISVDDNSNSNASFKTMTANNTSSYFVKNYQTERLFRECCPADGMKYQHEQLGLTLIELKRRWQEIIQQLPAFSCHEDIDDYPCLCQIVECTPEIGKISNSLDDDSKQSIATKLEPIEDEQQQQSDMESNIFLDSPPLINPQTTILRMENFGKNIESEISRNKLCVDVSAPPPPPILFEKPKKSIFDLDFDDDDDPLHSLVAEAAALRKQENIKIEMPEINKTGTNQNNPNNDGTIDPYSEELKREMDPFSVAPKSPQTPPNDIVLPIYEIIENPDCLAKEHFHLRTQRVTEFHVNALHNCYIPNVNGNWDNSGKISDSVNNQSAVFVKSNGTITDSSTAVATTEFDVKELLSATLMKANDDEEDSNLIMDGSQVVPKYGSLITESIRKDLSHVYLSHRISNRRHMTSDNKRISLPFLGVAQTIMKREYPSDDYDVISAAESCHCQCIQKSEVITEKRQRVDHDVSSVDDSSWVKQSGIENDNSATDFDHHFDEDNNHLNFNEYQSNVQVVETPSMLLPQPPATMTTITTTTSSSVEHRLEDDDGNYINHYSLDCGSSPPRQENSKFNIIDKTTATTEVVKPPIRPIFNIIIGGVDKAVKANLNPSDDEKVQNKRVHLREKWDAKSEHNATFLYDEDEYDNDNEITIDHHHNDVNSRLSIVGQRDDNENVESKSIVDNHHTERDETSSANPNVKILAERIVKRLPNVSLNGTLTDQRQITLKHQSSANNIEMEEEKNFGNTITEVNIANQEHVNVDECNNNKSRHRRDTDTTAGNLLEQELAESDQQQQQLENNDKEHASVIYENNDDKMMTTKKEISNSNDVDNENHDIHTVIIPDVKKIVVTPPDEQPEMVINSNDELQNQQTEFPDSPSAVFVQSLSSLVDKVPAELQLSYYVGETTTRTIPSISPQKGRHYNLFFLDELRSQGVARRRLNNNFDIEKLNIIDDNDLKIGIKRPRRRYASPKSLIFDMSSCDSYCGCGGSSNDDLRLTNSNNSQLPTEFAVEMEIDDSSRCKDAIVLPMEQVSPVKCSCSLDSERSKVKLETPESDVITGRLTTNSPPLPVYNNGMLLSFNNIFPPSSSSSISVSASGGLFASSDRVYTIIDGNGDENTKDLVAIQKKNHDNAVDHHQRRAVKNEIATDTTPFDSQKQQYLNKVRSNENCDVYLKNKNYYNAPNNVRNNCDSKDNNSCKSSNSSKNNNNHKHYSDIDCNLEKVFNRSTESLNCCDCGTTITVTSNNRLHTKCDKCLANPSTDETLTEHSKISTNSHEDKEFESEKQVQPHLPYKEYSSGLRAVDEDVNDDDGNNCARIQQFKEWHEVLELRSYNEELLTVLPYVVLE